MTKIESFFATILNWFKPKELPEAPRFDEWFNEMYPTPKVPTKKDSQNFDEFSKTIYEFKYGKPYPKSKKQNIFI